MNTEVEKNTKRPSLPDKKAPGVAPWILAGVGILYSVLPADLIPDIPFVGWVDDFFILSSSLLYLLETQTGKVNKTLSATLQVLRKITMLLGAVAILLILIFGTLLVNLFV